MLVLHVLTFRSKKFNRNSNRQLIGSTAPAHSWSGDGNLAQLPALQVGTNEDGFSM